MRCSSYSFGVCDPDQFCQPILLLVACVWNRHNPLHIVLVEVIWINQHKALHLGYPSRRSTDWCKIVIPFSVRHFMVTRAETETQRNMHPLSLLHQSLPWLYFHLTPHFLHDLWSYTTLCYTVLLGDELLLFSLAAPCACNCLLLHACKAAPFSSFTSHLKMNQFHETLAIWTTCHEWEPVLTWLNILPGNPCLFSTASYLSVFFPFVDSACKIFGVQTCHMFCYL